MVFQHPIGSAIDKEAILIYFSSFLSLPGNLLYYGNIVDVFASRGIENN